MVDFNKYPKGAQQAGNLFGDDLSNVSGGKLVPLEKWKKDRKAEGWTLFTFVRPDDRCVGFYTVSCEMNGIYHSFAVPIVEVNEKLYAKVDG